ncbi:uncharacterized protein LY79DRAFT_524355 [Colletotrichum navitas]|uniref:Uncharacterized protein n=1 Tax=Colletotrichum navitas TaxID=681940 RepID=A0AAD8V0E1_9PEZI|nr:uncharacterized protein LY79DRAFT_524355 [Colletotrichum navitas]KAK1574213.1 hypothetical protein LY79DRAFT_524355 [Colletotrichum navitas]
MPATKPATETTKTSSASEYSYDSDNASIVSAKIKVKESKTKAQSDRASWRRKAMADTAFSYRCLAGKSTTA